MCFGIDRVGLVGCGFGRGSLGIESGLLGWLCAGWSLEIIEFVWVGFGIGLCLSWLDLSWLFSFQCVFNYYEEAPLRSTTRR